MKPSIFDLATKELSQDAFFTWLLQWADGANKIYDEALNTCASNFATLLIEKQFEYKKPVKKVNAGRQWENIDIWAEINDEILIIIEDKTYTTEHSGQLETYKQIAEKYCAERNLKLVPIYLKTGSESSVSLKNVVSKGFKTVERKDLAAFLNEQEGIENDIFNDFKTRINKIEQHTSTYLTLKIKDWRYNSWEGFYIFLQDSINVRDWSYVSNPRGGFLGLWWHFLDWKEFNVYLQIEQGNLCFKIGEVYDNKSGTRNEWHDIIMTKAKTANLKEIKKPGRFGNGTYMTVAVVERKDWLGADDEVADLNAIVKKLKEYEFFLNECIK